MKTWTLGGSHRRTLLEVKITAGQKEREELDNLADWHGVSSQRLLQVALYVGLRNLKKEASGG